LTPGALSARAASFAKRARPRYIKRVRDFAWLATAPPGAFPKNTPNPDIGAHKWLCGPQTPLCVFKEAIMATGTVKFFNTQKGFGFIQQDNGGPDVFVHVSAVERAGMGTLAQGQKLSFDIEADQRSGKSAAANLKSA
jgi:cold shock protein